MASSMQTSHTKGEQGETLAAQALIAAGYVIVARNWRPRGQGHGQGEIDLIAAHRDQVVFVEVKASTESLDTALEQVTPEKRAILLRLADLYLNSHDLAGVPYRFDVVAVDLRSSRIEVIEDAIGW